jgi:hypothetical protein
MIAQRRRQTNSVGYMERGIHGTQAPRIRGSIILACSCKSRQHLRETQDTFITVDLRVTASSCIDPEELEFAQKGDVEPSLSKTFLRLFALGMIFSPANIPASARSGPGGRLAPRL